MPQPFPWDLWLVAISRSLRWLVAYEPPPGEAASAEVKVTVKPKQEPDQDG